MVDGMKNIVVIYLVVVMWNQTVVYKLDEYIEFRNYLRVFLYVTALFTLEFGIVIDFDFWIGNSPILRSGMIAATENTK